MKREKVLTVVLAVCMTAGLLTGCGAKEKTAAENKQEPAAQEAEGGTRQQANLNAEGFPIVNEEITLKVFGQQGPVQGKWDEMSMWQKYQEMTNIKLDFTDVLPAEGYDEKKSLMWASNEYPDIFVRAFINNAEIVKYGNMGILAPLEELIPQ